MPLVIVNDTNIIDRTTISMLTNGSRKRSSVTGVFAARALEMTFAFSSTTCVISSHLFALIPRRWHRSLAARSEAAGPAKADAIPGLDSLNWGVGYDRSPPCWRNPRLGLVLIPRQNHGVIHGGRACGSAFGTRSSKLGPPKSAAYGPFRAPHRSLRAFAVLSVEKATRLNQNGYER